MTSDSAREKSVLIVLDDPPAAALVHRVIDDAGFRPFIVSDATDARELLANGLDPCIVLFALEGSEDARDFITRHGADPRTRSIPVIFFTAHTGSERSPEGPIVAALIAFLQTYCGEASRERSTLVH
jgi:CheY-like chemotaxis protein